MERAEFKVSRFWKTLYTVGFVFLYGYLLVQLVQGKISAFSALVSTTVATVLILWLSPYIYRTRLTVDENGITIRDPQLLKVFRFDWSDIRGVRIRSRLDKVVVIELHEPQHYTSLLSPLTRFNLAMKRIVWGFSFGISTHELDVKAEDIHTLMLEGISKYGNQGMET